MHLPEHLPATAVPVLQLHRSCRQPARDLTGLETDELASLLVYASPVGSHVHSSLQSSRAARTLQRDRLPDLHWHKHALTLAFDQHGELALGVVDAGAQFVDGARGLAVDGDDHITRAQTGFRGRTGGLLHEQTALTLQRAGFVGRQRPDRDTELALLWCRFRGRLRHALAGEVAHGHIDRLLGPFAPDLE